MDGEFELIAALSRLLPHGPKAGEIGIGDDCAAIPGPGGTWLLTCDSAVEGRHFKLRRTPFADIGWRVAMANVSDVCACGGLPEVALVSLGVPDHVTQANLEELYRGLGQASEAAGFRVLGGNVSGASELVVDVFMLGITQRFVPRGGLQPGHLLGVSNALGGAAAGLALVLGGENPSDDLAEALRQKHLRPRARTDLAPLVAECASACIDISDGLGSELGHMAAASGMRLNVEGARVPIHAGVDAVARKLGQGPLRMALHSGEEYALLVGFAPTHRARMEAAGLHIIGEAVAGTGGAGERVWLDGAPLPPAGWDHLRR